MTRLVYLLTVLVLLGSCKQEKTTEPKKAKNIILMIGDGMGVNQVYAAMSVATKPLSFEQFKYTGFHKTYSANAYITDSGAGGTALATGVKTNNRHIGVDPIGKPLKSILKYAEEHNLATGLVATSSIVHATPASFIANDTSRYNYEALAYDFLATDIDLFIAGGRKYFDNRSDSLNLIDSLKNRGYNIVDGFQNVDTTAAGKFAVFTAEGHNPSILEGRDKNMLPQSTENAINILNKDKDGFFLMVEGSQIDWGGHDNDIDYVVSETIDFDHAVKRALEFAKKDGETLLIVTADHETGGLALVGGEMETHTIEAKFTTDHHSSVMVPVFAYGPGAENFGGIYENTEVFDKMMKAFGFTK
ncbi:MAG: alkaline phosphatase [Bacteroidetes bacterium]|nr:alkaline phosphatase [Bacteroidota bacterium]